MKKTFPTLLAATLLACQPAKQDEPPRPQIDLSGRWAAQLASPGGELPFGLELVGPADSGSVVLINGPERSAPSPATWDDGTLRIEFEVYDAFIEAQHERGQLTGQWQKVGAEGKLTVMDFSARRGDQRFTAWAGDTGAHDVVPTVAGDWAAQFVDEDEVFPAVGKFREGQDGQVTGTFLTPTGDYRFLAGRYGKGVLRLSTFDGAHAFLFHARARNNGTLEGDFWSRDSYHATWKARRKRAGEKVLPDSWQQTGVDESFTFAFPNLEGELVSLDDPRFAGKPVVVNIFGSWCPNCHDEAPVLADLHRRYRDQGLEMVGLAFEHGGNFERDARQVRRFAARHDLAYPLLIAGTSEKDEAAGQLTGIDEVIAYPTTIFLDREHRVVRVHSGFTGPGTGEHFDEVVAQFRETVETLL